MLTEMIPKRAIIVDQSQKKFNRSISFSGYKSALTYVAYWTVKFLKFTAIFYIVNIQNPRIGAVLMKWILKKL